MKYSPLKIEKKWQKIWLEKEIYKTKDLLKKPKLTFEVGHLTMYNTPYEKAKISSY